jgi:hypothetical protein
MSAVPREEGPQQQPPPAEPLAPGWCERRGLTLIEAEDLLDQLEVAGVGEREAQVGPDGVTVRWRPAWPRLLGE